MFGPLMYLLYVKGIGYCTERYILPFPVDTTWCLFDSDPKICFEKANIETNKLFNWFYENRLLLTLKRLNSS